MSENASITYGKKFGTIDFEQRPTPHNSNILRIN